MVDERTFITRRVERADTRSGFACGEESLDTFFRRFALGNQKAHVGATYVLRRNARDAATLPAVLGYYTLSAGSVTPEVAIGRVPKKPPRYPQLGVAHIGRLAVHIEAQGQGIGADLLLDAFGRVMQVASLVGCVGVTVDALNSAAVAFYRRFGFEVVDEHPGGAAAMFVSLETVAPTVR